MVVTRTAHEPYGGGIRIPIRSMTGYVQLSRIMDNIEYMLNLKSLNSKGIQLNVSLPRFLSPLEVHVIQKIKKIVNRGKIDFRLNVIFPGDMLKIRLNRGILESYVPVLKEMAGIAGYDSESPIPLELLVNLDNVFIIDIGERILDIMKKHMDILIEDSFKILDEFRISEGERLKIIIQSNLNDLKRVLEKIEDEKSNLKEEYREKLNGLFEELGKNLENLDTSRLEEEVLFLVERSDITEEIDRLRVHIERFEEILENGGSVGSKLDFLCQEMHRELNTIASKARNATLIHLSVDGRELVKKIREQVQNIE